MEHPCQRLAASFITPNRPFSARIQATIPSSPELAAVIEAKPKARPATSLAPPLREARVDRAPNVSASFTDGPSPGGSFWPEDRSILLGDGGVEELVYSPHSKCGARKGVGVRVPSPLPLPSLTTFGAAL